MKKSGFTLTEVLGVVIIIVLIGILAFPPILQQINKTKNQLSEVSLQVIYSTTENYLHHNQDVYYFLGGNVFCIKLQDLVQSGFLDKDVVGVEVIDNISLTRVVKVDVISKTTLEYELVYNDNCNEINHETVINADTSGASVPKLSGGMIPIKWDGTKWIKASYSNQEGLYQWYDYKNQEWANAVLVTNDSRETYKKAPLGTPVVENDVLAYLVWIPRYKYQLFNVEAALKPVQEINIEFESRTTPKSSGKLNDEYANGEWLTHPAFTFGEEELTGFWVGKFETSTTTDSVCYITPSTSNCNNALHIPLIKPNVASLRYQNAYNQFETAKKFNDHSIYGTGIANDSHMMKSTEWGAVAYLSQSKYGKYGNQLYDNTEGLEKEVWVNPNTFYLTGCAGSGVSELGSEVCNQYHTENGSKASTTGNVYGVYDMSGGSWETVMAGIFDSSGQNIIVGSSGFNQSLIDDARMEKYINKYEYGTSSSDYSRRILGDATGEVRGWYGDSPNMIDSTHPGMCRGGHSNYETLAGLFSFGRVPGGSCGVSTFRTVMLGS